MQDIVVTVIALIAGALILRSWLKRRAAAVPAKCANCAVAEEFDKVPRSKGAKVQRS